MGNDFSALEDSLDAEALLQVKSSTPKPGRLDSEETRDRNSSTSGGATNSNSVPPGSQSVSGGGPGVPLSKDETQIMYSATEDSSTAVNVGPGSLFSGDHTRQPSTRVKGEPRRSRKSGSSSQHERSRRQNRNKASSVPSKREWEGYRRDKRGNLPSTLPMDMPSAPLASTSKRRPAAKASNPERVQAEAKDILARANERTRQLALAVSGRQAPGGFASSSDNYGTETSNVGFGSLAAVPSFGTTHSSSQPYSMLDSSRSATTHSPSHSHSHEPSPVGAERVLPLSAAESEAPQGSRRRASHDAPPRPLAPGRTGNSSLSTGRRTARQRASENDYSLLDSVAPPPAPGSRKSSTAPTAKAAPLRTTEAPQAKGSAPPSSAPSPQRKKAERRSSSGKKTRGLEKLPAEVILDPRNADLLWTLHGEGVTDDQLASTLNRLRADLMARPAQASASAAPTSAAAANSTMTNAPATSVAGTSNRNSGDKSAAPSSEQRSSTHKGRGRDRSNANTATARAGPVASATSSYLSGASFGNDVIPTAKADTRGSVAAPAQPQRDKSAEPTAAPYASMHALLWGPDLSPAQAHRSWTLSPSLSPPTLTPTVRDATAPSPVPGGGFPTQPSAAPARQPPAQSKASQPRPQGAPTTPSATATSTQAGNHSKREPRAATATATTTTAAVHPFFFEGGNDMDDYDFEDTLSLSSTGSSSCGSVDSALLAQVQGGGQMTRRQLVARAKKLRHRQRKHRRTTTGSLGSGGGRRTIVLQLNMAPQDGVQGVARAPQPPETPSGNAAPRRGVQSAATHGTTVASGAAIAASGISVVNNIVSVQTPDVSAVRASRTLTHSRGTSPGLSISPTTQERQQHWQERLQRLPAVAGGGRDTARGSGHVARLQSPALLPSKYANTPGRKLHDALWYDPYTEAARETKALPEVTSSKPSSSSRTYPKSSRRTLDTPAAPTTSAASTPHRHGHSFSHTSLALAQITSSASSHTSDTSSFSSRSSRSGSRKVKFLPTSQSPTPRARPVASKPTAEAKRRPKKA